MAFSLESSRSPFEVSFKKNFRNNEMAYKLNTYLLDVYFFTTDSKYKSFEQV